MPATIGAYPRGSASTSQLRRRLPLSPTSSSYSSWRLRTPSRPISGPRLSATAMRSWWCLGWARHLRESKRAQLGEIHAVLGADFLVTTVRHHGEASALSDARRRMENEPALLCLGSPAIPYAIREQTGDDYTPMAEDLENDIDEIKAEVFGGNPRVSHGTYEVFRQVLQSTGSHRCPRAPAR